MLKKNLTDFSYLCLRLMVLCCITVVLAVLALFEMRNVTRNFYLQHYTNTN